MRVYCLFNQKFHGFLNEAVKHVLDTYGSQLNIDTLEEIELVNKNEFEYETDGRIVDSHKIIVTSRLYELLPSFDIEKLDGNKEYVLLRQALYHELGHINDMALMPNLYKCAFRQDDSKERIVSQFWLEYIAERRTEGFEGVEDFGLCDDFVKHSWKCTMSSFESDFNSSNFAYLIKVLPYFLSATKDSDIRGSYINQLKNSLLIEFIKELDKEILYLEKRELFDDVAVLFGLYNIINRFYKRFIAAYRK